MPQTTKSSVLKERSVDAPRSGAYVTPPEEKQPKFRTGGILPFGIGAAASLLFLIRYVTWPPAANFDAWAYSAWGQALARGERPEFFLSSTTPKPLATIIGAIVSPLPAPLGIALVVVISLGVLVAGTYVLARRYGGELAGGVAAVAIVVAGNFDSLISLVHIDALTAALVVLAVVKRGWGRVALFMIAGLMRPEAWVLAGLAVYLGIPATGTRRIALTIGATAAPAVVWMLVDLVLMGDALGTVHWSQFMRARRERLATFVPSPSGWEIPVTLIRVLFEDVVKAVVVMTGVAGLVTRLRSRREDTSGWGWIPLVAGVWLLLVLTGVFFGLDLLPRYFLPMMAMLAVGCGFFLSHIVGGLEGRRLGWIPLLALLVIASTTAFMRPDEASNFKAKVQNLSRDASGFALLLECDKVAITDHFRATHYVSMLSAMLRVPARSFSPVGPTFSKSGERFQDYSAVFRVRGAPIVPLPKWPKYRTNTGSVAVKPTCDAPEEWTRIQPRRGGRDLGLRASRSRAEGSVLPSENAAKMRGQTFGSSFEIHQRASL